MFPLRVGIRESGRRVERVGVHGTGGAEDRGPNGGTYEGDIT